MMGSGMTKGWALGTGHPQPSPYPPTGGIPMQAYPYPPHYQVQAVPLHGTHPVQVTGYPAGVGIEIQPTAPPYHEQASNTNQHPQPTQPQPTATSVHTPNKSQIRATQLLILRIATMVLAVVGLSLVLHVDYGYYSVKSTDDLRFVVSVCAVLVPYELVQIILVLLIDGHSTSFITMVLDQVFAYLMFAAAVVNASYTRKPKTDRNGVALVGVVACYLPFVALACINCFSAYGQRQ